MMMVIVVVVEGMGDCHHFVIDKVVHFVIHYVYRSDNTMPTKNPRINVVLEKGLYYTINEMAANEGISMSLIMRDLVKEALEIREDVALAKIADRREQTFDPEKALSHEDVWGSVSNSGQAIKFGNGQSFHASPVQANLLFRCNRHFFTAVHEKAWIVLKKAYGSSTPWAKFKLDSYGNMPYCSFKEK
ncbi:MAG TPA: hypothetical protein VJ943_07320 [Desulfotignum sp.]|nr:hypothetical protein [Desulfotignum sp.]